MAKKQADLDDLFKPTEPGAEPDSLADLLTGRTVSTGYGDKQGIIDALDAIAREHGVSRNELIRYAVRHFLRDYRAGRVVLEVEVQEKRRLRLE